MLNIPKINKTCCVSKFFFACFHPRAKPSEFQKEQIAYKKLVKQYRMKNILAYWERQTQIENEFIDKYDQQQEKKRKDDLLRFRTSVVRIAYDTYKNMEEEKKRLEKRRGLLHKYALDQEMKKMNRKRILKLLNLDSKEWFDESTIEQRMVEKVIVPDVIHEKTDYYLRLQEKAVYYETADFEELENMESDRKIIDFKNKYILPIYIDLIYLIKHAKNDEVMKLMKEFQFAKAQLHKKYKRDSENYTTNLKKITDAYNILLSKYYAEISKPRRKIETFQNKLIILFNLLRKWEDYMNIVKASNEVITQMISLEEFEKTPRNETEVKKEKGDEDGEEGDQMSAEEKATSGSDLEDNKKVLDLSKEDEDFEQEKKKMNDEFKRMRQLQKIEIKEDEPEDPMEKVINELFTKIERQEVQKLEEKYEEILLKTNKMHLYSEDDKKDMKDSLQYMSIENLDKLFPKQYMDDIQDFSKPKLDYDNINFIMKVIEQDQINEINDESLLKTSTIVEIYKKELEDLKNSGQELTLKEQKLLDQLITLVSVIGQFKIEEPKMLLKIWDLY